LVVGGMLSAINERLLEVSILTLGLMWLWLGGILLTMGKRAGSTEPRPGRLSESN
jgi:spore maturation protein SpmA